MGIKGIECSFQCYVKVKANVDIEEKLILKWISNYIEKHEEVLAAKMLHREVNQFKIKKGTNSIN